MLGYENWKHDDLEKLNANKEIWHSTTDENEKKRANEENKRLRAMYGMGDEQDISIGELSYYRNLAERQNSQKENENALLKNITGNASATDANVRSAANKVANFSYNPYADVVYQSYEDAYNRQGQSAAKQTLNNLNAVNMGRNSSYGAAAAAQVQQAYAQKLSEMIPQLAQQEYNRLVQNYGIERDLADSLYNRQLNAYNALANRESQDIVNDIQRFNRENTKLQSEYLPQQLQLGLEGDVIANDTARINRDTAQLKYEYLPQQLQQDLKSGELKKELSKLQIENMGYKNRKDAIAALIQETYGVRLAEAKVVAAELDNMY